MLSLAPQLTWSPYQCLAVESWAPGSPELPQRSFNGSHAEGKSGTFTHSLFWETHSHNNKQGWRQLSNDQTKQTTHTLTLLQCPLQPHLYGKPKPRPFKTKAGIRGSLGAALGWPLEISCRLVVRSEDLPAGAMGWVGSVHCRLAGSSRHSLLCSSGGG